MRKHGHTRSRGGTWASREYRTWDSMIQRCTNKNHPFYKDYGGRGITVCLRWMSFENFLDDMGDKPPNMTLNRKNNDGNYCKKNCEWATRKTQNDNTRATKRITFEGKTRTITQWAEVLDIPRETLRRRLQNGWSVERALTSSVHRWSSYEYKGETRTLLGWAVVLGVKRDFLRSKLKKWQSFSKIMKEMGR